MSSISAIQICNLALAKLGDNAQVTSISPPDGSMQANYCSLFYGQALNVMLEKHAWSFATRTAALSLAAGSYSVSGTVMTCVMTGHGLETGLAYIFTFDNDNPETYDVNGTGTSYTVTVIDANTFSLTVPAGGAAAGSVALFSPFWPYAYLVPADFLSVVDLREPGFLDVAQMPACQNYEFQGGVLFSAISSPVLVYSSQLATNPSYFPPLFAEALSTLLASYLAGPVLKGDVGVAAAEKMTQLFGLAWKNAVEWDCRNRRVRPVYAPKAIEARNGVYGAACGAGYLGGYPFAGSNNVV